jgi:hypothetical protein
MSRGPGRIERAIRQLLDANPDAAFSVDDLCRVCYPELEPAPVRQTNYMRQWRANMVSMGRPVPEPIRAFPRASRVAVWRAARHIVASDPDWAIFGGTDQRRAVLVNRASVTSRIMRRAAYPTRWRPHQEEIDLARIRLADPKERAQQEKHTAQHIEVRDADPAERPAIIERQRAEWKAEAQRLMAGYALPTAENVRTATLVQLAVTTRRLATENDPDAIRAGLTALAEALERLGGE